MISVVLALGTFGGRPFVAVCAGHGKDAIAFLRQRRNQLFSLRLRRWGCLLLNRLSRLLRCTSGHCSRGRLGWLRLRRSLGFLFGSLFSAGISIEPCHEK